MKISYLFILFIIAVSLRGLVNFEPIKEPKSLGKKTISLNARHMSEFVNEVFSDNILLAIHYMSGDIKSRSDILWDDIKKPFTYSFKLEPHQTFAFHEDVLNEYQNTLKLTTRAHFNFQEGFRSSGYLYGDGVCHLASLIHWVAKEANLEVVAPVNHDFRDIPEIPKEFGTSIYFYPGTKGANAQQNLYVTNTNEFPVLFTFEFNGETLTLRISEITSFLT